MRLTRIHRAKDSTIVHGDTIYLNPDAFVATVKSSVDEYTEVTTTAGTYFVTEKPELVHLMWMNECAPSS